MFSIKSVAKVLRTSATTVIKICVLELSAAAIQEFIRNLGFNLIAMVVLAATFIFATNILQNIANSIFRDDKRDSILYLFDNGTGNSLIAYTILLSARSLYISLFDMKRSLSLMILAFIFLMFFIISAYRSQQISNSAAIIISFYISSVSAVLSLAFMSKQDVENLAYIVPLIFMLLITVSVLRNRKCSSSKEETSGLPLNAAENRSEILDKKQVVDEIAQEKFADEIRKCDENSGEQRKFFENIDKTDKLQIGKSNGSITAKESLEISVENIMDDLNYSMRTIDDCVDFFLSNNSNSVFYRQIQ